MWQVQTTGLMVAVAVGLMAGCGSQGGRGGPIAWPGSVAQADYPLDGESRDGGRGPTPQCPQVQLMTYAGDVVPYHRPLKVNPFFRERLQHFEAVVQAVALKEYGRPPVAIRHFGAYVCRRIRGRHKLSEHSLGNAIDVSGFEFGPALDHAQRHGLPQPLMEGFKVSLLKHWGQQGEVEGRHAAFLRQVARELAKRPDIFRGMLGPGAPGHDDHFHFDMGRWRYIDMN